MTAGDVFAGAAVFTGVVQRAIALCDAVQNRVQIEGMVAGAMTGFRAWMLGGGWC